MGDFLKTKEDITAWLHRYAVYDYTLIEDPDYGYTVSVAGDVNLNGQNLSFIPVKFSCITKNLLVEFNQLTTLEFCPPEVGQHFFCGQNKLTSLNFCPVSVGKSFSCHDNQLISLEFCPKNVGGDFLCDNNFLTSLEFCPTTVGGYFYCADNPVLKDIQEISDFSQILNLHQEIANIKKERESIEGKLRTVVRAEELPNKNILKI